MKSKKMYMSFAMAIFASASFCLDASAATATSDVTTPAITVPAMPAPSTSRLYLVKNENGFVNALRDDELDAPAKITRLGNARKVSYNGHTVDVQATIVMRGNGVSTINTDTPQGDSEDE